jgi:hypothetical protein
MVRAFITALLLAIFVGAPVSPVSGQILPQTGADLRALETRLQERFQILPIANGVVLTPKFKSTVRAIEVTDRTIALDGAVVTGAELREKLGTDADLIFQLSYLDAGSRRSLLGLSGSPAPPAAPTASEPPTPPTPPVPPAANAGPSRPKRRDDIVRFGGNVTIASDEVVAGDVAVIGGSADIDGEVNGDVAVIGGSLTLGPHANIKRDVTVVGGKLVKDPGAIIEGKVAEVGVGDAIRGRREASAPWRVRWGGDGLRPIFGFAGTLVRVALVMLLAGIVLLVARAPVQQIADKAAAEPLKSWAIGFLAEILFVPVLVLTIVVLAVSIVGIPFLLLVPVAIVAAMVVCLIGFTGVAYHIGRLIEERFEQVRNRPYLATIAGICVIVAPLLVARVIGLVGGLGVIAGVLLAAGFVLEYVAWTTGLGAAALVRFGRQPSQPQPPVPSPTTV